MLFSIFLFYILLGEESMKEIFYKLALERLPVAFAYYKFFLNNEGEVYNYIYIQVNHAFTKMVGLKREQIIGRKATEIFTSMEQKRAFSNIFKNIMLKDRSQESEPYLEFCGHHYRIQAILVEGNYFAVCFFDITKEKQQRDECEEVLGALQDNELMLDDIIKNLPLALHIISLDGKILLSNEAAQRLFEINEEFINKASSSSFWVNEEDRLCFINDVMKKGIVKECK